MGWSFECGRDGCNKEIWLDSNKAEITRATTAPRIRADGRVIMVLGRWMSSVTVRKCKNSQSSKEAGCVSE